MSKQTAVEWLVEELEIIKNTYHSDSADYIDSRKNTIELAKEMEKEQIIDACNQIKVIGLDHELPGEKYYKKTFNK